jgi:hypothetical protein
MKHESQGAQIVLAKLPGKGPLAVFGGDRFHFGRCR